MRRSTIVVAVFLAMVLTGCGANTATTQSTQSQETTTANAAATTNAQPQTTTENAIAQEKTASATVATASWASAIGDSAMLGAVDALQKVPDLVLVDAQGSRQAPEAIDLLQQYRAASHLGDVVVVHLGNNGPFTAEGFDELMGVLKDVRKVLVVNLTIPPDVEEDPVIVPNNAMLAEGVQRYLNKAVLVDWYSAGAGHPEYVWDGIHLTPEGAEAYASLIASYLEGSKGTPGNAFGPKEEISWGELPRFGRCVGPPSWCSSVARS
jgi:uncharacterized protein YceK